METTTPIRLLTCSVVGCKAAWYEMPAANGMSHQRAIRRARLRGWVSDGQHGCMCADRYARCPDHAATGA